MPTLTVRNVSDSAYARLVALAEEHRRSVSQEAALLLERALLESGGHAWAVADRVRERLASYGPFPDSTDDIAGDRRR